MAGICKIRLANFIENHHIPFVKILSLFLQNFVHAFTVKLEGMENLAFYLSLLTHHNAFMEGGRYRYKEILQRTNKQAISQFSAI